MMPGHELERHGDALEPVEAQEVQHASGSVSWAYTGGSVHPEDDMLKPPGDGWPEEEIPRKYMRMASDPMACLAQAAELLDHALTADVKERDSLGALASRWMRLASLSHAIQADEK